MRNRSGSSLRAAVVTLIAGFLMPAGAQAQTHAPAPPEESVEPAGLNSAAAVFDVLIVRPFGFAVLPVGVAAFIPVALLSAPGGKDSFNAALEHFITAPAEYVFTRPLGDF